MNKEQALTRLTSLENEAKELRKIIEAPAKPTAEDRFWQLCQGLKFKIDPVKYPKVFFLFKEDEYFFEYNSENGYLWCRHEYIWSVFETEYKMKYNEIQTLIKTQVENHFKCKGVTPDGTP